MPSDQTNARPAKAARDPGLTGLRAIALIKVGKGLLLTGLAFGIFRSINRDLGETVRHLTFNLRIDPENHFIRLLLEKLTNIEPKTLRAVGWITAFYAAELYVEGVGLWLNQAWAKWVLLIATGFFIPEEAYVCIRKFDAWRLGLLMVNIVVLVYVIWLLWVQKRARPSPPGAP